MMEDRKKILSTYLQEKPEFLVRSFLKYDRYYEAENIRDTLKKICALNELRVVDYGCGVGDYGMTFYRENSDVMFIDYEVFIRFVLHRWAIDPFKGRTIHTRTVTTKEDQPIFACDLVIFGEVLEHLKKPLNLIAGYAEAGAVWIFTSSYPMRGNDPDYFGKHDHSKEAGDQQEACKNFLLDKYFILANYGGQFNLWQKKN